MRHDKEPGDVVFEARDLSISAHREDGARTRIVRDVSFKVRRGEVVSIIGESGSGKTTLALSALGYCRPGMSFDGGQARLLGRDVTRLSTDELRQLRGTRAAYMAQSAAATFNPALTVNAQVTESPVVHGILTQDEANRKARALYEAMELPNPETIGRHYPHQVSGGQLQRLMAAMALCGDPDLLILDEPTTALDVTTQIEVLKTFKKVIRQQGTAAIYVSHDLSVVSQIADRIVVMYGGEIKEAGPTDVIIRHSQHSYTQRLIAAIKPMPRPDEGAGISSGGDTQTPLLEVRSVRAGYGAVLGSRPAALVLRDINLSVDRAKTLGVIGESGCGKSTLARVIAGLLPASSGQIMLNGKVLAPDVHQRSRDELRRIQFVYQSADTALNPMMRIRDILGRPAEFYTGVRGTRKSDRVAELLELVELPRQLAERYPHELSGGQKQRVNLARALAANPEVVLCDEVTSALDTIVGANVINVLKRLQEATGVCFVFISHDLSTVSSFADEIAVLYAGRLVEKGPVERVLAPPHHPYTRLLMSSVPKLRTGWLDDVAGSREAISAGSGGVILTEIGCPFFARCSMALKGVCDTQPPPQRAIGKAGHMIECHRDIGDLT